MLSYISKRLWVERSGALKITLDDFLRPTIAAWKDGKPYAQIVYDLPKGEASSITSSFAIPFKHPSLSCFTRGYASDCDCEIDIENDDYDEREEYEILLFLGYPFLPYMQP